MNFIYKSILLRDFWLQTFLCILNHPRTSVLCGSVCGHLKLVPNESLCTQPDIEQKQLAQFIAFRKRVNQWAIENVANISQMNLLFMLLFDLSRNNGTKYCSSQCFSFVYPVLLICCNKFTLDYVKVVIKENDIMQTLHFFVQKYPSRAYTFLPR